MASYSSTFPNIENPLSDGGLWASVPGPIIDMESITGGFAQATGLTGSAAMKLNTSAPGGVVGANQYSKGVVQTESTGGNLWLFTRFQASDGDCYALEVNITGTCDFYEGVDTGTMVFNIIGLSSSPTVAGGDTIEFRVCGCILAMLINNVLTKGAYHSGYTSGQPGFGADSTTAVANQQWASVEVGDLTVNGPTVAGVVENLRTGTTDPWTFSHDQGTTAPKGVLLVIVHGTTTQLVDTTAGHVTYGGVTMTQVRRNTASTTEAGTVEVWFVGSGIPTGTQTVSIDLTSATTQDTYAMCLTLDAAADLEVLDHDGITNSAVQNGGSVTLQYGGRGGIAFGAVFSGQTAITNGIAVAAGVNISATELTGNITASVLVQALPGTADFTVACTHTGGTADDFAMSAVAIGEVTHMNVSEAVAVSDEI